MCDICKRNDCPDAWGEFWCRGQEFITGTARPGKSVKVPKPTDMEVAKAVVEHLQSICEHEWIDLIEGDFRVCFHVICNKCGKIVVL
jgi:hypothetical protein